MGTQSGLVSLESLLQDVVLDHFREGPRSVRDKVAKAPYEPFVCVKYERGKHGFVLEGAVHFVERLLRPVYVRVGAGHYMDALVHTSMRVHARYERRPGSRTQHRVPGAFYYADDSALVFERFIKHSEYRPAGLVFAAVDDLTAVALVEKDAGAWESYFMEADRELARKFRAWRADNKAQRSGNTGQRARRRRSA